MYYPVLCTWKHTWSCKQYKLIEKVLFHRLLQWRLYVPEVRVNEYNTKDPASNQTTQKPRLSYRDSNCSGIVMSSAHLVRPKPSCKALWKGEEDKADRRRGGKTTSGNGQAWGLPSPRSQWRTKKNGQNWLWNHLWCPNDPRG